jgi:hypothetical protein
VGTPPVVGRHAPSMLGQARIGAPSSSRGRFSLPQEILGRSGGSESQPLVTNPRYGCSYRAGNREEITPRAGLWGQRTGAMGRRLLRRTSENSSFFLHDVGTLTCPRAGFAASSWPLREPRRCVYTRIAHTKLGGDKNMDGRRLDAGNPSEEDPRRTNGGHDQRALHSP